MNQAQRELARHALGLPNRDRQSFRNRYVAPQASTAHRALRDMEAAGEAEFVGTSGAGLWFTITRKGAEEALDPSETLCPEDFPPEEATP